MGKPEVLVRDPFEIRGLARRTFSPPPPPPPPPSSPHLNSIYELLFFLFPLERSDVSRLPLPPVARRPKLQRPQLRMLLAACVRTTTAHACMLFNGQLALQVGSGGSEKRRHFSFCVFWTFFVGRPGGESGAKQAECPNSLTLSP